MADATKSTKVQLVEGGDTLVVASGGKVSIESGGILEVNGKNVTPEVEALDGTSTIFGAAGTPVDGVKASLVVNAGDTDLTFTAVAFGAGGNAITIETVADQATTTVEVAGNAITINKAVGGATAAEVKTAYDLVPAAVALATVAFAGDGSGAVDTIAATPLAGGVDVTAGGVPSLKVAAAGDFLFVKVSAQVWKKVALAAL